MDFNSQTLKPDARLGNYTVVGVLGQGGFGITYKVLHNFLGSAFAIKEYMPSDLCTRDLNSGTVHPREDKTGHNFYDRGLTGFINEAKHLAKLSSVRHPNLVSVIDFFEANGTAYIVMEFLDGIALNGVIEDPDFDRSHEAIGEMLRGVLDGLEEVHSAGLLHRDIKPANICLIENNVPVLIDFGSAKSTELIKKISTFFAGTLGYSALEHDTDPDSIHFYSDIYSVGVSFRELITGIQPVSSLVRLTKVNKRQMDPMPPLLEGEFGDITQELLNVVNHCCELHYSDRPQNVSEVKQSLMQCESPSGISMNVSFTLFNEVKEGAGANSENRQTPVNRKQPKKIRGSTKSTNPLTRCENCLTVFEVPAELLQSSDTRVRCGECLGIFDAANCIFQVDEKASADGENPGLQEQPGSHSEGVSGEVSLASSSVPNSNSGRSANEDPSDLVYSDFDLFSDDAELPEIAWLDESRNQVSLDFDDIELTDDLTFSDTLFRNDVTIKSEGSEKADSDTTQKSSSTDEMDTMMDLAKAYIDMGDDDSAQSALGEIIKSGTIEQKKEATNLLKQIAASH